MREELRELLTDNLGRGAARGHRLLEHLFDHPIVTVSDVRTQTSLTYQAANDLLARFETFGILREMTGKSRNRVFLFERYTALMEDDEQASDDRPH